MVLKAERAAEKFPGYPDCRKLLLVQFYEDSFSGVGNQEISYMIRLLVLQRRLI